MAHWSSLFLKFTRLLVTYHQGLVRKKKKEGSHTYIGFLHCVGGSLNRTM